MHGTRRRRSPNWGGKSRLSSLEATQSFVQLSRYFQPEAESASDLQPHDCIALLLLLQISWKLRQIKGSHGSGLVCDQRGATSLSWWSKCFDSEGFVDVLGEFNSHTAPPRSLEEVTQSLWVSKSYGHLENTDFDHVENERKLCNHCRWLSSHFSFPCTWSVVKAALQNTTGPCTVQARSLLL